MELSSLSKHHSATCGITIITPGTDCLAASCGLLLKLAHYLNATVNILTRTLLMLCTL